MRKILSLMMVLFAATSVMMAAEGGTLTPSKTPFEPTETVTLTYDGTGTNFANWEPLCFVHAWLVAAEGKTLSKDYGTAWASCNGDADYAKLDSKVKMTLVTKGKYTIDINIKEFFGVAEADLEKIGKMGIIVRAQYEGDNNKTNDFFINVSSEQEPPTPVDSMTVYFVNTKDWTKVQAYLYTNADPWPQYKTWPGEAMTKTSDKALGKDVYKYTFPASYNTIIFNNKTGDEGVQLSDATWSKEKPYYMDGEWFASLDDIKPVVPAKYYVTGDSALVVDAGVGKAKAWNDDAIKSEKDTCVLNLKKDQNYKLKVVAGGKWLGYDKLSKKIDGLNADEDGNINFKLNEAGEVKVVFIAAEKDTTFELIGDFYYKPVVKKELKLVPGAAWNYDGAKFAAYLWGDNDYQAEWTPFFAGKGDTLMTEINAEADSMVLVRFSDQATVPSWEKEDDFVWGKIDKIEIDYASLVYTVTSYTTGTWDVYVPAKYYITGDSALVVDAGVDKAKAWSDDAIKSEKDTCVLNLKKDQNYKLKVVAGGNWLGYDKLSKKVDGLNADEDGNINFKLNAAGEVKVVFIAAEKDTTFELIGDFYVAPPLKAGYYLVGTFNEWTASEEYLFGAGDKEGEFKLTHTFALFDKFKIVAIGGEKPVWYPAEGDDFEVSIDYTGEKTIYFNPKKGEGWTLLEGYIWMESNNLTGYYLVGAFSNWLPKTGYKFEVKDEKIQLETTLTVGQGIKAAHLDGTGEVGLYYPDGEGTEYVVDAEHAGDVIIYFNPVYNGDWADYWKKKGYDYGHWLMIEKKSATGIDNAEAAVKAVKMIENGMLIIEKAGVKYNAMGQKIQ